MSRNEEFVTLTFKKDSRRGLKCFRLFDVARVCWMFFGQTVKGKTITHKQQNRLYLFHRRISQEDPASLAFFALRIERHGVTTML